MLSVGQTDHTTITTLLFVVHACWIHGRSEVARQEWRSSSEVEEMSGVEDLSVKFSQRRMKWFGHVKRAEGVCWVRWVRWGW